MVEKRKNLIRRINICLLIAFLLCNITGCTTDISSSVSNSDTRDNTEENTVYQEDATEESATKESDSVEEAESDSKESDSGEKAGSNNDAVSQTTETNFDNKNDAVYEGKISVLNISTDDYVRSCEKEGDLSQLGSDEYYDYSLVVTNYGQDNFVWSDASVSVDGGDNWHWQAGEIEPNGSALFFISYENMQTCIGIGSHHVSWYVDGRLVYEDQFTITRNMDWGAVFDLPSSTEISEYSNSNNYLSPYIYAWLTIPEDTCYTEFKIDFKSDYFPNGTYLCLGNWQMNYASLKEQYVSVRTEADGVQGYAGFQKLSDGTTVGILSLWDVFCTDANGNVTTIRASRVYPSSTNYSETFSGEGTGVHSIVPSQLTDGHWYQMHLKCTTSQETGNTIVEQWLYDLESGEEKLISSYDVGSKNASFQGSIAVFLENFMPQTAGNIRSLEICNASYYSEDAGGWVSLTQAYTGSNSGLPVYSGSYNYGVQDNRLWMITSGVGGDWYGNGKGKTPDTLVLEEHQLSQKVSIE